MNIQNPEAVVESPELGEEIALLSSYWTPERMAGAQPLPLSVVEESVEEPQAPALEMALSGESSEPTGETFQSRSKFSTSVVEDRTVHPYQCIGKLFMKFSDGDYVCSAYVIGESTIGTAGHCVYLKGEWASQVLFQGQYHNNSHIDQWSVKRMATLKGWVESNATAKTQRGAYPYDMAFGITRRPIAPKMGKLGWIARNAVHRGSYTQIGYPNDELPDYPFNGEQMWDTIGDYVDHTPPNGIPKIIKAGGNMTRGCSGGPWTVFKDEHWRVNGLNSFRREDEPDHINSPYFGQTFVNLIEWMRSRGGDDRPDV